MMTPSVLSYIVCGILGLVLAIPSNTCIVIVHLESIRKKEKLSPSDVIFMAKAMVNILLQCSLTLHGMFFILFPTYSYIREIYSFVISSIYFLTHFSFWLTVWLSAHYCTSITNLRYGFFIWIKRIVSNSLSQVVVVTACVEFSVTVLIVWAFTEEMNFQVAKNSTEPTYASDFNVNYLYFVPVTFLGCILPFCLTLLCLLLTFSFLVRHVWRVKNNDSGSSRPNLQAHVTALRTISLLLFMFTSFSITEVLMLFRNAPHYSFTVDLVISTYRLLSPSAEGFIIFQASTKLRRFVLGRIWTRRRSDTET